MSQVMQRAQDLEVHEVPDGYIIYQTAADNVCYLNKTAAITFEFCDGKLGADEVVTRVAKAFDLDTSAHAEIKACLDSLVKEGLIVSNTK